MQPPPDLTKALASLLDGVSRKELAAAAQKMSAGYRGGATSQAITTPAQAAAYAVARMPATTAACAAVFARIAEVMPGFAPASLLDVGAGTGAASWAAMGQWPGLASIVMLDQNPALRALARRLADAGPLRTAEILSGDLGGDKPKSDVVVASYVLAELPEASAGATAKHLWSAVAQMLVLVEPGTPDGFARIRSSRAALIEAGARVVAPCTHDKACPMAGSDWCHFSQRLPRSRDHMLLKGANVPFEDERYSYVVVTREKIAAGARILAPPLESKPGVTFKLCDENGLRTQFVASRDKEEYRRVRKRGWGDLY
ncbi:MAG: small ribosomal subunit Rsm22 family protein [Rhizomicrobium sp.]